MSAHWELFAFLALFLGLLLVLVGLVAVAWYQDRKRWRNVPRHMGSTYDASSRPYRPNVDLRRVRHNWRKVMP
jgi:hypothetical protein